MTKGDVILSLFAFRPSRETSASRYRSSCPRLRVPHVGFASPLPRDRVCALCVFLESLSPSLHRLLAFPDVLVNSTSDDFCHAHSAFFAILFESRHLGFRESHHDSWALRHGLSI